MQVRRCSVVVAVLGLVAACATTPGPATAGRLDEPSPEALPLVPVLVQTARAPLAAVELAEGRLIGQGFGSEAPVRPEPGLTPGKPLMTRARASVPLVPEADRPAPCAGDVEVVQVSALVDAEGATRLRLACYTDRRWRSAGAQCQRRLVPGCPRAGDALVGAIAADASSAP